MTKKFHLCFRKDIPSYLELSWTLTKMTACRNFQPRHRIRIVCVRTYIVSPPAKSDIVIAEAEENDHSG